MDWKDIILILVQLVAIITFTVGMKAKVDSISESTKEIKEIVVEMSKDVKEMDIRTTRDNQKILNLEREVFGNNAKKRPINES